MLLTASQANFISEDHELVTCTLCPVMETLEVPGGRFAREVRVLLSALLDVSEESVELYVRETRGLVAVSDESYGIRDYYVLLRLRGGKGGFRKQLEKKGRAYARARRLREANQSAPRPKRAKEAVRVVEKSVGDKKTEADENESMKADTAQVFAAIDASTRNAVLLGVKKVLENLTPAEC
ncbi:hypothetical protein LSM04_009408 [Trypanosoma melophagium]|uniref:uncharacterized protein n=1 Tax=Trypanosoma melophagium TaxID=715481 RepID=UPI00351A6DD3|nr:hypothetical protein LSM04_002868 [Trypanosoma melophagium]KAH9584324.1 hypothetical protein LSM04_009408 [Trypanosoma melophagium]